MKFIKKLATQSKSTWAVSATLLGLMSNMTSFAQAQSDKPLRTYGGQEVEAIDIHLHTGSFDKMGPLGQKFILNALPKFLPDFLKKFSLRILGNYMLDPYGPFIGIQTECEKAGVAKCGLLAVYTPKTWGITTNEEIMTHLANNKNQPKAGRAEFFGFASVAMDNWETNENEQLESLRKSLRTPGMKGIKLAFIHNEIPLDESKYNSIYQVAQEFNAPVYHHVGSSPLRNLDSFKTEAEKTNYLRSYDPKYLEKAISGFPDVTFILGHMGFDFNKEGFDFSEDVYQLAKKYPNIVLEISAFGRASYDADGKFMDSVLKRVKAEGLLSRTLYGSDGPGNPGATKSYLDSTLLSMERVGYTVDEAQRILSGTSKKYLNLN